VYENIKEVLKRGPRLTSGPAGAFPVEHLATWISPAYWRTSIASDLSTQQVRSTKLAATIYSFSGFGSVGRPLRQSHDTDSERGKFNVFCFHMTLLSQSDCVHLSWNVESHFGQFLFLLLILWTFSDSQRLVKKFHLNEKISRNLAYNIATLQEKKGKVLRCPWLHPRPPKYTCNRFEWPFS